ncbi:MAG: hypothetical protein ACE5HI_08360 [bacterium]
MNIIVQSYLILVPFLVYNIGANVPTTENGATANYLNIWHTTKVPGFEKNVELDKAKKYFNNGQFQKAIDLLERLVAITTLPREAYLEASELLAVAHVSINQEKEAEEIFSQILHKYPDYKIGEQWWPHKRLMTLFYKISKKEQGSLKVSSKGPGIQTIAIMDFENNSIDDAEKYGNLGNALAKIIISDFAVLSKLRVVERERIQFIIDELELTAKKVGGKNIMDPEYAPRVGKLLGAHSFVFGSFMRIGKTFRMDVRLVKTETGEIFKTASVEGKPDKILDLAKQLTVKITKDLKVKIEDVEKEKIEKLGKEDIPIEALALFGDAMSKANQEEYRDASVDLEAAIAMAPNFQKAHDMLTVIRPLTL